MESQSEYRKSESTQDHIFTLKETITKTLQRTKTYTSFIDWDKAFDVALQIKFVKL